VLPVFVTSITTPDEAHLDPNVVATNALLTLLVILLFALTSAVFNSTIDDNRDDISGFLARLGGRLAVVAVPLGRLDRGLKSAADDAHLSTLARVFLVLILTGLIYGFLSPDFGPNPQSVCLFIGLVLALGFVTYVQEGGSTLLAIHRYHAASSVRLFGLAIGVAIACVLMTRLAGLQPGFLYGFVASSVILAPVALGKRAAANLVVVPTIALLVASVAAWALMAPLHAAVAAGGSWLAVLALTVAGTVFVAGLEGVFYAMIPLTFMDGAVVWRWRRLAWLLLFGTATFLFWQLVINPDAAYVDAMRQPAIQAILAILAVYGTLTLGVWLYFWWRSRHVEGEASAQGGVDSLREAAQEASEAKLEA
jgi:hypothetical protein